MADTNMLEVKKLLDCLVTNGYELEGIQEAGLSDPNDAIAVFLKNLNYHDAYGHYINDSEIKVSIHFEKRADYTKIEKDEDDEIVYNGDPEDFITDLIKEIKHSKHLVKVNHEGGKKSCKKRCKKRGKKRKTQKNVK